MMGALYEGNFRSNSQKEDAEKAVEYYKKAYALDPTSTVIGEQLAEMYFASQQTGDAITEAQAVLKRNPSNVGVRRLLARIYIRSLGEISNATEQRARAGMAIDQLKEITRLDTTDSDSALWLSRLYRLTGQDGAAEQTLRSVVTRDTDNIGAVAQLAQLLVDHNNTAEAVPLLDGFLADTPNADLYDLLGDAYGKNNNLPKAEEAYRQSVKMEPDRVRHVRGLAQSLFDQDKYSEALTQYQRMVELRPDDSDTYLQISKIYRREQRLDDAERQILLAKQHAPGNLEVVYNEATLYEDQGRFGDALHVASDALAAVKNGDVTPARRRNLAVLYQLIGRVNRDSENYSAAISAFQQMQQLGPEEDLRARVLIVESYKDARDLTSAFSEINKALGVYPNDRSLKINQALLYGQNGQPDVAAKSLRALLSNSADDREIQLNLAEMYMENRRYAEAETAISSAEKLASDPADSEMTNYLRGSLYERQQKFDLAEVAFKSVLSSNPHNSATLNYYGYMLADRGVRLDEAVDLIRRALAEDPGNASYLDSMGWVRFKQNRLDEAEDYLRKAVNRDSHNPDMLTHLGDVLAKSGKEALAAAQWEKAVAEWRRALPADQQPSKVADLEQKLSRVKNRVAQESVPAAEPR
jgi:tetratricopeptide (TPR) repeat protein